VKAEPTKTELTPDQFPSEGWVRVGAKKALTAVTMEVTVREKEALFMAMEIATAEHEGHEMSLMLDTLGGCIIFSLKGYGKIQITPSQLVEALYPLALTIPEMELLDPDQEGAEDGTP
jgi:hypothetical protein